jgi:2-hydroxy-6-oxonona-2,4-dienedioate hydrolase
MDAKPFRSARLVSRWHQISDAAARRSGASGRRPLRIHARVGRDNNGGKPALVLVPGLVVTSRNVAPTARLLQETFSVYALDLPGFGKSDKPARVLTVPQLATALLEWMDVAGLPEAHLLGNSFGCQVIVEAASRHPERVCRLVLTGPALDPAIRTFWQPVLRLLLDGFHEPALIAPTFYDFLEMGPRRVWGTYRAAREDHIEDKLPRLPMPVLLVRGEHDPIASQSWMEKMASLLPNARTRTLSGAPHALAFSVPQEVARLTETFCLADAGAIPG